MHDTCVFSQTVDLLITDEGKSQIPLKLLRPNLKSDLIKNILCFGCAV